MPQEKLKQLLEELKRVEIFEDIKSKKDFDIVVDIIQDLIKQLSELKNSQDESSKKILDYIKKEDLENIISEISDKVQSLIRIPKDGERGEKGDRGEPGLQGKSGKDGADGKHGRDGLNGNDGLNGKDGLNGADGSPDTPEIIKQKLESLDNEEKLSIEAIKDLREELDKLKKTAGKITYIGGGGATGGRIVKAEDVSSKLNGSTKTFSLPAFWRIISVHSSSFPNAFRETTDYTVDGSLMQITFTSQIDAPTTLATGQTIIILYAE